MTVIGLAARKRISVTISILLLVAVLVTFLTGFIAAALDLNRFVLHKYAAYAALALAAGHVVLHWRALTGQVRRWLLGSGPVGQPAAFTQSAQRATEQVVPRVSRRTLLGPGLSLTAGLGLGYWWATTRASPVKLEDGQDLGQVYHQWSKPTYAGLLLKSIHIGVQPPPYKEYPNATRIALPRVPEPSGISLEEAIARRRSVREFAQRPLTQEELSRLLHYSMGITDRRDPTLAFRAVPSSGALYPIELYAIIFDVEGVVPGAYHYDVRGHHLNLIRAGDFREQVFHAAVAQEMLLHCSLALVFTGLHARVQWKYVDRAYRYVMLEAGHLGQNVYLAATALGLGPCGIGAFFDDDLNRLVGVDGVDEVTVYLMSVGPTA